MDEIDSLRNRGGERGIVWPHRTLPHAVYIYLPWNIILLLLLLLNLLIFEVFAELLPPQGSLLWALKI